MFYTYIHYKLSDNQPFYVGKGKGNRAYVKRQRSKEWNEIVKENGFYVKIHSYFQNESDSFIAEKELIFDLKKLGAVLCNKTSGGQGTSGRVFSKEQKMNISNKLRKYFENSESKEKLSALANNRFLNNDEREKVSNGLKRYYFNNPDVSYINSAKRKELLSKNQHLIDKLRNESKKLQRKLICLNNNIKFDSITEAQSWLISLGFTKAQTGAICRVCNGKSKNHYGFIFKYI